ncbi:dGTPase inhibitor [Klebsiella phage vB_Ko_K26PH128C1]|uniref:DGTPase inhibitor n=1 Tax=Klebsiella phage vB_Ko_K26PH128C1 TaxID=3071634 RepID=A0AAV1MEB0_9CAUD|nr:dGTPase inhibitor [Klebsiella phage vB_Ko_K26PH128C1]
MARFIFDGSTSQWSRLGASERRLVEATSLKVDMQHSPMFDAVVVYVYESDGRLLMAKPFSRWSIDSASDWLAKLTADYASWK